MTTAYETKKDWRDEFVYQHFPNTGYWPTLEAQYRELGLGYISPPSNIAAIHSLRVRWDIDHWTIAVTGSGFPHPPTRDDKSQSMPFTGDLNEFSLVNLSAGGWSAGWTNPPDQNPNWVTLKYRSWSETDILIDGFDGKYGESGWRLEAGQRVHARIYSSDGRLLACRSAIALL